MTETEREGPSNKTTTILLSIFIALGLIARFALRSPITLWEDEIIAATHAVQPIGHLIFNVILHDIHPPLYFLSLHFWSLFDKSDIWLTQLSSVFSYFALLSIFLVTRLLYGTRRSLFVAAVFSVLPVCLWMAQEVRMYAMLSVLLIWAFYFSHQAAQSTNKGFLHGAATFFLSIAIIYTHAIGFFAIFILGINAAAIIAERKGTKKDWVNWLILYGCIGLATLPMLISDVLHPADMAPLTGFSGVTDWMAGVIVGNAYILSKSLRLFGIVIYCAIVIVGLIAPRTRRLTFIFLILPILICLCVGYLQRPLFKTNFFSNFYSPFLAIVFGLLLSEVRPRTVAQYVLPITTLAGLLMMAISGRLAINKTETYYEDAMAQVKAKAIPGDVVWAPQEDIFWAVNWYLIGPGWGSPLKIASPIRQGSSWYKLFDKLGPNRVAAWELMPQNHFITQNNMTIFTASSSEPEVEQAQRLWLVTFAPRGDISPDLPSENIGLLKRRESYNYPPIQLSFYSR